MSEKLGLREVIALGIGGLVSGGIFATLGVAMTNAGNAVPLSFILAGIITIFSSYSYVKLTLHFKEEGGSFSFIEHVVENKHIAGFFGWILIIGYVGTMALYAFAFGAYLTGLFGSHDPVYRAIISVVLIVVLAGVNLLGIRDPGILEDVLVYIKAAFLLFIAFVGIFFFKGNFPTDGQFFNMGVLSPITTFAIIFVAYEGYQLLTYEYRDIENVEKNLGRGLYISVVASMIIYISVSFMATLYLTPQAATTSQEYALAQAVTPFLGFAGFFLVVITALQSTASGINATLFGSARLAHKVSHDKELPKFFSFKDKKNIPTYAVIVMAAFTSILTAVGTLEQITEFASLVFIMADAAANYANVRLYKKTGSNVYISLAGLIGCLIAFPIVIYFLFTTKFLILLSIIAIFAIMLIVEFFYIERETVEEKL